MVGDGWWCEGLHSTTPGLLALVVTCSWQQPEGGRHCKLPARPKHSVQACGEACVQEHGVHHGGRAVVLVSGIARSSPQRTLVLQPFAALALTHPSRNRAPCAIWGSNQWITTKTLLESIRGMGDPVHVVVIDDASSVSGHLACVRVVLATQVGLPCPSQSTHAWFHMRARSRSCRGAHFPVLVPRARALAHLPTFPSPHRIRFHPMCMHASGSNP